MTLRSAESTTIDVTRPVTSTRALVYVWPFGIAVGPICTQLLVPATGGAIDGPAPATALVAAAGASAAGADAAAGAAAGTAVPGDSSALPSVRAASSAWSLKSAVRLMVLSGPPRRAARGAGRPVAAAAAASMLTLGTTVSSPEMR